MSEYDYDESPPGGGEDYGPEDGGRSRGSKYLPLLTGAVAVMAVSSLVTAGAAVTMAVHSHDRTEQRIAELASAHGGNSRDDEDGERAVALPDDPGIRDSGKGKGKDGDDGRDHTIPKGGHARHGDDRNDGGSASARDGSGSAGAADRGDRGEVDRDEAPVNEAPVDEEEFADAIPEATADILLSNTMSASDASLTSPQRYYWAVDGAKAGPTLDQVADIRARAAAPPGMEDRGVGGISFEVRDVVVNGDTATATLVLIFPGEWGKWEYPDSGFQYVDGEWKLQKSAVCNLAKAAWIDCY